MTEVMERFETLAKEYDDSIKRKYNRYSFGPFIRTISRYVTLWMFKAGMTGPHVMALHFCCDAAAIVFVSQERIIPAFFMWFAGHFLDNCDGDLARLRGEADEKWGTLDNHLHLYMNMAFWVVLFILTHSALVVVILCARVVTEWHRLKGESSGVIRYGEKSKTWSWLAYPTNVNAMYLFYVLCVLAGHQTVFLWFYATYIPLIALGQTAKFIAGVIRG